MNCNLSDKHKIAVIVGGSILVGSILWKYLKTVSRKKTSRRWRRVGEVTDLLCYPIKSCGWIQLDVSDAVIIGIQKNKLRDRSFMVVDSKGSFITGRNYPTMVLIKPKIDDYEMSLTAPNMPEIKVNFLDLEARKISDAFVWDQPVKVVDAGDEAAAWFSKFILQEETGLRLVYYPSFEPTRDVRPKNKIFETAKPNDTGALHDATSFMLMNEASIEELNSRLDVEPVTHLNFRPNILVKGPKAFEEDNWTHVKIGEVIFLNVKPCTRCTFTNVNPITGEKSPEEEPLKTLRTYRKMENCGNSPVLGIHLGVRQEGKIHNGDAVYVAE